MNKLIKENTRKLRFLVFFLNYISLMYQKNEPS